MNLDSPAKPQIPAPATRPVLHAFGDTVSIILDGSMTGGKYTQWLNETAPGGGPPPHRHLEEDEWFFVIEGEASFFDGTTWHRAGPGGSAYMPRGSVHTFKNTGTTPLKTLVTTSPSGFETFFSRCAAEFAKPAGPEMARILEIAAEHGIEFVNG